MELRNLLLAGGVVGLVYYAYTLQKKKEMEAKAKKQASSVSKTVVTATQVEDSIKKEEEKSIKQAPTPLTEPIKQAPIKTITTTTTKIVGSVKLPPANTDTKVVKGVKPKVLLEFESPSIKNVFSAPSKTKTPTLVRGVGAMREEV
jgi:hypothetical protein